MGSPFSFQEERNAVYYHNIKVFICGADVTPYLTSQISINKADRDGINSCTFSLSNAMRCFEMTRENLVNQKFRMDDSYSPSGHYAEDAKFQIYTYKSSNKFNTQVGVQSFGATLSQGKILRANNATRDESQASSSATSRYPFTVGSLVFHKYDPIRVFVMDPTDRTGSKWTCEFAGYLDSKPYTQDYVSGLSTINISAQDIRMLMQQMRTQTNPAPQTNNENALLATGPGKVTQQTIDAGFFNDLVANKKQISHVLAGFTFRQTIKYLIFGNDAKFDKDGTFTTSTKRGAIGALRDTPSVYYDPATAVEARALLEDWNNVIQFGEKKRYLTLGEMLDMGKGTTPDGVGSPDAQFVRTLFPANGAPLVNMVGYSIEGASVTAKIDWASRLELLNQMCKGVDYQFYVTGMGDLIFEFPMYDFDPPHYNEVYNLLYTFEKQFISDDINDEGGTAISALVVTSDYLFSEVEQNNPESGKVDVGTTTGIQKIRTIFSNPLASRIGMQVETYNVPQVKDHNRLVQLGMMEFMKRVANYDRFSMNVSYRPHLGVNRPMYHALKDRIGITRSVNYSWRLREDATVSMDLFLTRKKEGDGKYRYITGGEATPISYNSIFTRAYLSGSGVNADQETDAKAKSIPPKGPGVGQ